LAFVSGFASADFLAEFHAAIHQDVHYLSLVAFLENDVTGFKGFYIRFHETNGRRSAGKKQIPGAF